MVCSQPELIFKIFLNSFHTLSITQLNAVKNVHLIIGPLILLKPQLVGKEIGNFYHFFTFPGPKNWPYIC